MLQMQVKRLMEASEDKNKKLQELQGRMNNSHINLLEKIKKQASENDSAAIFLLDQILNFEKKKPKWSELTIRNCVMWRIASPKGYEHPRLNILRLPCRQTLNRYISTSVGVNTENLIKCRLMAEAEVITPIEHVCSLIIDDMAIKEKCYYSRPEDKYFGFDTTQESSSKIGKKPVLANKMLCYVIRGLSTKYTIPAAYYFHKQLNSTQYFDLTINVLKLIKECGFTVLRMVTDNHKSNVALFKLLGDGNLITRIKNPVMCEIPLFLSFDYCHAQKNARNIFLDHDMESKEGTISADYVRALYNMQKDLIIKPAVQIFSSPVTAALEYLGKFPSHAKGDFSNSRATVTFMKMMNLFFKIHDVSDRLQHIRQLDETHAPFVDIVSQISDGHVVCLCGFPGPREVVYLRISAVLSVYLRLSSDTVVL
ncbi:hypothetical protein CBL_20157 [Carabus blaptoides fortunei]